MNLYFRSFLTFRLSLKRSLLAYWIFDSFFIKTSDKHNVKTRFATRTTFYVPKIRTNYGKFNIRFNGPILWNETDERFKILTPYSFKSELSMHFINLY